MRLRWGRGSSICWNQNAGPIRDRVDDRDDAPVRSGDGIVVVEDGLPERSYRVDVHGVDGHLERLRRARHAGRTGRCRERRDLAGQVDVEVGHGVDGMGA